MLSGYASSNLVGLSVVVTMNPVHQPIVDDLQNFCMLKCSGCKQKKHTKERQQFGKCQPKTTLIPRCTFQIDLIYGSSSTTASVSDDLAEKLLSMTAEDIYDTTCVKATDAEIGEETWNKQSIQII